MKTTLSFLFLAMPFAAMAQSGIATHYGADQAYTNTNKRSLGSVTLSTPSNGKQTVSADAKHVYTDATSTRLLAKPGEAVTVSFGYAGDWMNGYVYIDRNGDKQLTYSLNADHTPATDSELMSYSFYSGNDDDDTTGWNSEGTELKTSARNTLNPPTFTLPDDLTEGEYVIRFKVDWNSIDPAGDTNATNGDFMVNGGAILDATLVVTHESVPRPSRLHFASNYGFFVGSGTETGVPDLVPEKDLRLKLVAPAKCYTMPSEVLVEVISHDGTFVDSQTIAVPSNGIITVPADAMKGGDVYISAEWGEPDEYTSSDYQIAFEDEFDGGEKLNTKKWRRGTHDNNSAWNRYVNSKSPKVVYIEDGELVNRCIPCAPEDRAANEDRDWMSGSVDTKGKYNFQYGRVDVRALTCPFTGSFPAIWMMPQDQSAGWPYCGEIDIWEMIDAQGMAYGTVHAAKQSQKSGFALCSYDGLYHVYTFEWTADKMTWSIDGKSAYSTYYKSSISQANLDAGYWPFDKKFYLILNQSVGNGSWAKAPIAGHEYETRFDFVRIYQTKEQNVKVGIDDVQTEAPAQQRAAATYDLLGRVVDKPQHGVYVKGGKKIIF